MVRLLGYSAALGLLLSVQQVLATDSPSIHEFEISADLSFINASGYPSWTEGAAGKLRYDSESDGLTVSRAFVDYKLKLSDTVSGKVVANLYDDDLGPLVDFTEAYLEWRPQTTSANRYRFKLGAFYPRASLENTAPGWSSPYTISSSALNTWVAEEFRTLGAEIGIVRRPQLLGGAHTFSLHGAVFYYNDPAGALLSWKGWSIHDRQTRFNDLLPLPPIPQIQPGMFFRRQDPFVAPFREIDHEPGYYISADWGYHNRLLVRAMHYDNRGNPRKFEDGQYAWGTDFDLIGIKATLPGDVGLIYQWMGGLTVMGPFINGAFVVDADYYSDFLLLTKSFGSHRLSLRYDRFEVDENDQVPLDDNSEYGTAWTLAYTHQITDRVSLIGEWLAIETYREAWEYFDLDEVQTERQLQLTLRLRFGSHR